MTIYEIKSNRIQKGWSQQRLADAINVSQNAVYNWENGKREPNFETLWKIAKALGIEVIDLLPKSDGMPEDTFNSVFGSLVEQSDDIQQSIESLNKGLNKPVPAFVEYLQSLKYKVSKAEDNRWIIRPAGSDTDLYITNAEMKTLERTTKENIDLRINSFLHDGKHIN